MFSLKDRYIVVNYHYVENPRQDWKGIHPCSVKEFERQIDFLSNNFEIVSVPKIFEVAKKNSPGRFCAFTFDDCMRDTYDNAVPLLKKHGLKATFFPITLTLEGRLPLAHKIHVLLSKHPVEYFVDDFNDFVESRYPAFKKDLTISKSARLNKRRRYENVIAANFKETLINLPGHIREEFLDNCFQAEGLDEKKIAQQLFMTRDQLKSLFKQGMDIGNHSNSHSALDILKEGSLKEEIRISQRILCNILGREPEIFSYPYGRKNASIKKILKQLGFEYALSLDERGVNSKDEPFWMPRYDTNSIKFYLNS